MRRPLDMRRPLKIDSNRGRYTSVGYKSSRLSSVDGLSPTSASGDRLMEYERDRLLAQSRFFYNNNAIYHGMIDRATAYIVGTGFTLQMTSTNGNYNKKVEGLWRDFWKRPEIRGLLSGCKVEKMVAREMLLCGDTGAIKTNEALIQLVEAEQIAGPAPLRDGIKKDEYGRPVKYLVSRYKNGRVNRSTATGVDPKNFIFVTNPDRPSSTRSVPAAQAAFAMLHRINDVCDSEAISWQLLSRMAVSIIREDGPELGYEESKTDPAKVPGTEDGNLSTRLTELDYALMFHGNPGEKIEGIDRNIPGKDFPASIRMFLRLLGLPLGLPLEVVLLDWTKSNYSQSRAVLEQAYQMFRDWQVSLKEYLLTPIFEWKMEQWANDKKIVRRAKDGMNHNWIAPTYPWIDQLKEAKAYGAKVDRGFSTHATVLKSLNRDRADDMDARVLEVEDAITRAQKISKATGEEVPWQIFAGLEVKPATMESQIIPEPEGDPDDDEGNDNAK